MNESDLALTKFAMRMKAFSMEQLERCVELQQTLQIPISTVFLGKKLLNEEQYNSLVEKVNEEQKRKDIIFAKVAIALKYLTASQVKKAQEEQENRETAETLSAVLLEQYLLSTEQVQNVLANVRATKAMTCVKCNKKYSMTPYISSKKYSCSACDGVLELTEEEQIEEQLRQKFSWNDDMPEGNSAPSVMLSPETTTTSIETPLEKDSISEKESEDKKALEALFGETAELSVATTDTGACKTLARDLLTKRDENINRRNKVEKILFMGAAKDLQLKLVEHKKDELCGEKIGDYLILERIGAGAMGVVYKAEQIKLQRIVAIKMLNPSLCNDDFYVKRFLIETRSAAKLNHPNIVQIYDADIANGRLFYSMEYIRGENISNIMDRLKKIPPKNCIDIILQTAHALVETYESGIVHRDIKPENILLTVKGIAKLADLGLARNVDYAKEMEAQESQMMMGTPYYVAPEQITNSNNVDCRTDIYSLGASLYAMITGEIPFRNPDPRVVLMRVLKQNLTPVIEMDNTIPPALSWVISKMLEKKPEDRFQTPLELIEVLEGLQSKLSNQRQTIGFMAMTPSVNFNDNPIISTSNINDVKFKDDIPNNISEQKIKEDSSKLSDSSNKANPITPPIKSQSIDFDDEKNHKQPPSNIGFSDEISNAKSSSASGRALLKSQEIAKVIPNKDIAIRRSLQKTAENRIPVSNKMTRRISQEEEKESPWGLIGGVVLFLGLLSLIIFIITSGKETKKPEKIDKPIEVAITPEESRKKDFANLSQKIEIIRNSSDPNIDPNLFIEVQKFAKKYPSSMEVTELNILLQQLQTHKDKQDIRQKYKILEEEHQKFLQNNQFISAYKKLEEIKQEKNIKYIEKEIEQLYQDIEIASQKYWENCDAKAAQLQKQGYYDAAITELEYAQKSCIKSLAKNKIEEIQKIQNNIFRTIELLNIRDTIYSLLRTGNYLPAKKTLEEMHKKSSEQQKIYIQEISEEVSLISQLLNEELYAALQEISDDQKNKKMADYPFEFEEYIGKEVKRTKVVGKIINLTNNITIKSKTSGVLNSINKLTWSCKRNILELRMKRNEKLRPIITYSFALYALSKGDYETADKEIQLAEEKLEQFQEIKLHWLTLEFRQHLLQNGTTEVREALQEMNNKYGRLSIWEYIKYPLANYILLQMKASENNPTYKEFLRQLLEKYYSDTKIMEEIKKFSK